MSFRYLIIDRSFCLQNGIDTNMLCFEPFLGNDEKLNALLDELDLTYSSDDMFSIPRTRSVALNILLYICERHGTLAQKNESATGSASAVKKAIDYIHASYRNDFSLDDVAEFIGINKYYLSHEFSKYTGYSFVAYVNRTRCKNACRLLEEGNMNISEVGKMCGLENRSYFAKCFKKNVGVLPSEYAKRVCANNDKILSTNIYKKN